MTTYWIGDAEGRVLGPVALEVIHELVESGRLLNVIRASTDGRSWNAPEHFPEIEALLLAAPKPEALLEAERKEAARVREQLKGMQGRSPQDIFRLDRHASVDAYRNAFFKLVKRFYPDRVRAQAHPDLRRAYSDAFQFLSRLMVHIEKDLASATVAAVMPAAREAPPSTRFAPPASAAGPAAQERARSVIAPPPPRAAATYQPHEFVGLERREDRVEVTVQVTPKNSGMFTQHPLVNLQSGGVFLSCGSSLPLGTPVDVIFRFDDPRKEIRTRGRVIFENSGGDPRSPMGFGIRLVTLPEPDRTFVQSFLQRSAALR